jgi:hypothetical protein
LPSPKPVKSESLLPQNSTSSFPLSHIHPLSHVLPIYLFNVLNALLICITINFHQNLIKIIVINYLFKFFSLLSYSLLSSLFFSLSMDSSSSYQTQTTLPLPIIFKSALQPYSKSLTLSLSTLPLPIVSFNCCLL